MKILVKSAYHNQPAKLHFDGPGEYDVDEKTYELLKRDAPENFDLATPQVLAGKAPPTVALLEEESDAEEKALDKPVKDKAVKAPAKKK